AVTAVEDCSANRLGPGQGQHLPANRCHRQRNGQAGEIAAPRARGNDNLLGRIASAFSFDRHNPVAARLESARLVADQLGAVPDGISAKRLDQALGIERTLASGPKCPKVWTDPGPSFFHLRGIQPIAQVALLSLPGYLRSKTANVGFAQCDIGNSISPESDLDASRLFQGGNQIRIEFAPRNAQLEKSVAVASFDLGSQHARGGAPGLPSVGLGVEDAHTASGSRKLASASGADGAATHDNNVSGIRHLGGL